MTISLNERKKWEKEADTAILNSGSHNQMFEMSSRVLRLLAALRATETRAAEFEGQAERYSQELACAERERDSLASMLARYSRITDRAKAMHTKEWWLERANTSKLEEAL